MPYHPILRYYTKCNWGNLLYFMSSVQLMCKISSNQYYPVDYISIMIVCFSFFLSHTYLCSSVQQFCLGSKQKSSDFSKSAPRVQKEQRNESAAVRWIASGSAQLNNRNWYACYKIYCGLIFYLLLFTVTFSCPYCISFRHTACSAFKPFVINQQWSRTLKRKLINIQQFLQRWTWPLSYHQTDPRLC